MLTGGTTMFQGIMEHMTNELTALAHSTMRSRREFGRDVKESTTQNSNRLRNVSTRSRPTCSQTETSSLSAPNVSFTRVFFPASFIGTVDSGVHDTSFHIQEV